MTLHALDFSGNGPQRQAQTQLGDDGGATTTRQFAGSRRGGNGWRSTVPRTAILLAVAGLTHYLPSTCPAVRYHVRTSGEIQRVGRAAVGCAVPPKLTLQARRLQGLAGAVVDHHAFMLARKCIAGVNAIPEVADQQTMRTCRSPRRGGGAPGRVEPRPMLQATQEASSSVEYAHGPGPRRDLRPAARGPMREGNHQVTPTFWILKGVHPVEPR